MYTYGPTHRALHQRSIPHGMLARAALALGLCAMACGGGEPKPQPEPKVSDPKLEPKVSDPKLEPKAPEVLAGASDLTGHFGRRSVLGRRTALAASSPGPSCPAIDPTKIHRFVEGQDACVVPMSDADVARRLGDGFGTAVLRQGSFPMSVDAIVTAVDGSSLGYARSSFMVGEGSQIPTNIADRDQPRNLRYVLAWISGGHGEILLSAAPGGRSSFHQVIAWNDQAKAFNFYQAIGQVGDDGPNAVKAWAWAGESSMATAPDTKGKGCFGCHHNGVTIMKELEAPWNNWHSQDATISPLVVPQAVASEPYFQQLSGAEDLENVIRNNFTRYYDAWLDARIVQQGDTAVISDVPAMLRHLVTNTTINLASTSSTATRDVTGIPSDFYLWDDLLYEDPLEILDFDHPTVTFPGAAFETFLGQHQFELQQHDGASYTAPGSTYFRFFVPIPSQEDAEVAVSLVRRNVVTAKLAAAIAMVDLGNPVFSSKRAGLWAYAEAVPTGTIAGGRSTIPDAFAAAVRATNPPACAPAGSFAAFDACSAESQFLYVYELPDASWTSEASAIVTSYLGTITAMDDAGKLEHLMGLAARRRQQLQQQPLIQNLDEFTLLLPRNDLFPLSTPPSR